MKYIKKFNEDLEYKDVQEQIDDILDNLSKKGELSNSEKEFMQDASNGKVIEVTIPKPSGNFWSDVSNPHNAGIMWNDGRVWKQIKSIEDEDDEELDGSESSDEKWERKKTNEIKNYLKNNPGLKSDLEKLLELEIEVSKLGKSISNKYKNDNYKFNQKLDYATNGKLDSLINQFGYIDDNEEDWIKSLRIHNEK